MIISFGILLTLLVLAIGIIDYRHQRIPDALNLIVFVSGLSASVLLDHRTVVWALLSSLIAAAMLWLLRFGYQNFRNQSGLGLGDVKFVGASAAWIGLEGIPSLLLVASGSALVLIAIVSLAGRTVAWSDRLPFGPFLGFGLCSVWFAGPLENWVGFLLRL